MSNENIIKEKPILMSAPMVKAILDGSKTQTRRIVKPQPHPDFGTSIKCGLYHPERVSKKTGLIYPADEAFGFWSEDQDWPAPYGAPGDRLWVKERFYHWGKWVEAGTTKKGKPSWRFDACKYVKEFNVDRAWRYAVGDSLGTPLAIPKDRSQLGWHKRPSIFMPRFVARIQLELTHDVRVERLQDISSRDALLEGLQVSWSTDGGETPGRELYFTAADENGAAHENPKTAYKVLWESINGPGSWALNPYVWCISFRKL